ncbi:MAG: response regulator [Acidobacteriota bacterium]
MSDRRPVLLVEDDSDIREMIGDILEHKGYNVMTASSGQEALDRLATPLLPGLILLDLMMPGMSGVEFRKAQTQDPRIAPIPVVVLSGDAGIERKSDALGVAGYVKKPIELRLLIDIVDRFCGARG